jgi:hypothetical protein
MVNPSDAHGTLIIKKNNSETSLETVKKLLQESEKFYYGNLVIDPNDVDFEKELEFSTSGRWSLYSTLEHYFDNFETLTDNEKQEINGLSLLFDYVDYEPGFELFEDVLIEIAANYENNELRTIVIQDTEKSIEINAYNLEHHEICDAAFDTFTIYGIENLQKALKRDIRFYESKCDKELLKKIIETKPKQLLKLCKENEIYACDNTEDISWL